MRRMDNAGRPRRNERGTWHKKNPRLLSSAWVLGLVIFLKVTVSFGCEPTQSQDASAYPSTCVVARQFFVFCLFLAW